MMMIKVNSMQEACLWFTYQNLKPYEKSKQKNQDARSIDEKNENLESDVLCFICFI